jgi:hypothetical protein
MDDTPDHIITKLKKEMVDALEYDFDDSTALLKQAKILDRAFRHLIGKGVGYYGDTSHFMAAFRAQNQCRYTLGARAAQKKNERKQSADPEKSP